MRVTLASVHNTILANLNKITTDMYQINKRISSQSEMSKISDDPVNLVAALSYRSNLAEIKQYQENLTYGETLVNSSDNSLSQIKDAVMRAKVLTLQGINGSLTADNRESASVEIAQLYEQIVVLSNTQVNNKYLFGGFRTMGYTETEPAPFMDGYVDGHRINGQTLDTMNGNLTGTVDNSADIAAGDLLINGVDIGGVTLDGVIENGLNMLGTSNLKTAVNLQTGTTYVTASLTTLYATTTGTASDNTSGSDQEVSFDLNDVHIVVDVPIATVAADIVASTISAINAETKRTGVSAVLGDGANGGTNNNDVIVLKNIVPGDESVISITNLVSVAGGGNPGLVEGTHTVDASHNTGELSLSTADAMVITTSTLDDAILDLIGLGGGSVGFLDEADDGTLTYGAGLASGDLKINGITIGAAIDDGNSDVFAAASADAKANAINALSSQTGVTAEAVPVSHFGSAVDGGTEASMLTGTVDNSADIAAGDLYINNVDVAAVYGADIDLTEADSSGVNMLSAYNLREALNDTQVQSVTEVTAHLTTLYGGSVATADTSGAGGTISFDLNGTSVSVSIPANSTAAEVADLVVDAVNNATSDTGIVADVGDGSNGGVVNSVVLNNTVEGDETDIVIANLMEPGGVGAPASGLADGTYEADATHNTGTLSYASESAFTITSPNTPLVDDILALIGLDGGEDETGIEDDSAGDGSISYGSTPEYLASGDLIINGVDIFSSATAISDDDKYNVLMNAINAKTSQTGITATRDHGGRILLTASDGRNLHIETSALGEKVTNLNDASPSNPQYNRVYFGSVQLKSDNRFILETTPTATSSYETGLAAIGMAGGESVTGEADDISGDGRIDVFSVKEKEGSIRYAGDRENDLDIKIGKRSTLTVSKNGQGALMDTGVFSIIKTLEEYMQGNNYRSVTGVEEVEDTTMTLAEINSEMDVLEQQYIDGWFSITVTDHNYSPTHFFAMTIEVDTEIDTPESIATKINGIPGMSASYDDDGYLQLETIDSERYTFEWAHGNANFLEVNGISQDIIQVHSLGDSLADLDDLMVELTSQIADFGARSNRIVVQSQIFDNLELATTENLSEKQDTDILEALMQLKAKETAYQAALSAAAQTMQLSLVNFL